MFPPKFIQELVELNVEELIQDFQKYISKVHSQILSGIWPRIRNISLEIPTEYLLGFFFTNFSKGFLHEIHLGVPPRISSIFIPGILSIIILEITPDII